MDSEAFTGRPDLESVVVLLDSVAGEEALEDYINVTVEASMIDVILCTSAIEILIVFSLSFKNLSFSKIISIFFYISFTFSKTSF